MSLFWRAAILFDKFVKTKPHFLEIVFSSGMTISDVSGDAMTVWVGEFQGFCVNSNGTGGAWGWEPDGNMGGVAVCGECSSHDVYIR